MFNRRVLVSRDLNMKSHIHSRNLLLEVDRILSAIKSSPPIMVCWTVRERISYGSATQTTGLRIWSLCRGL
uniref:(California timema) hypothetical protein n=1 Tax=Timema californicum TaxID=61474 RepID=A0A7R9JIZ1_TIMCA|nr:unnamed protein product [Timema californicum]